MSSERSSFVACQFHQSLTSMFEGDRCADRGDRRHAARSHACENAACAVDRVRRSRARVADGATRADARRVVGDGICRGARARLSGAIRARRTRRIAFELRASAAMREHDRASPRGGHARKNQAGVALAHVGKRRRRASRHSARAVRRRGADEPRDRARGDAGGAVRLRRRNDDPLPRDGLGTARRCKRSARKDLASSRRGRGGVAAASPRRVSLRRSSRLHTNQT